MSAHTVGTRPVLAIDARRLGATGDSSYGQLPGA